VRSTCCFCQGQLDVRLWEDALLTAKIAREACDYKIRTSRFHPQIRSCRSNSAANNCQPSFELTFHRNRRQTAIGLHRSWKERPCLDPPLDRDRHTKPDTHNPTTASVAHRLSRIFRGLIMVVMALDHTRTSSPICASSPNRSHSPTPRLSSRAGNHPLLGPMFSFSAGTCAFLYGRRHTPANSAAFSGPAGGPPLLIALEWHRGGHVWTFQIPFGILRRDLGLAHAVILAAVVGLLPMRWSA